MIRKATKEDANKVSKLIYMAIGDLINIFTGIDDDQKALKNMETLFNQNNNRFSKEFCFIYEIDNQVVGSIIAYPADIINGLNKGLIDNLKININNAPDRLKRLSEEILSSKEAFDGEFYIDNLAVDENFRGKGISKFLINHIEEYGKELGYNKISLLAHKDNEKATKIYEKMGYVKDEQIILFKDRYYHMVKKV